MTNNVAANLQQFGTTDLLCEASKILGKNVKETSETILSKDAKKSLLLSAGVLAAATLPVIGPVLTWAGTTYLGCKLIDAVTGAKLSEINENTPMVKAVKESEVVKICKEGNSEEVQNSNESLDVLNKELIDYLSKPRIFDEEIKHPPFETDPRTDGGIVESKKEGIPEGAFDL